MKIIGYTVGTPLPKPNLKQTDPTKGDYVKGKEILDEKYIKVDEQELTDEQKAQVRTNVDAVSIEEAEALTDSVAFIDVEDNENVDVPDSDVSNIVVDSALSTSSTNPVQNKVITEKINEITSDIETLNNSIENLPAGETVQSDWNQSDSNAPDHIKNRPFGEETVETNIEGMTFGTFPHADPYAGSTSAVAHGFNIPFAPGQVWTVTYKIGSNGAESTLQNFEVQQYDDGTLYIGDYPVADGGELYITSSDVCYNESWARMIAPYDIKLVGVSGSVTETALKKIDPKYLPDSGKAKIVFELDADNNAHVTTDIQDLYAYFMECVQNNVAPSCIYKGSNELVPITRIMYDDFEGAVFCYFAMFPTFDFSAHQFIVIRGSDEVGYTTT